MFNENHTNSTYRPRRAYEIDLRVKEMDKKFALLNLHKREESLEDSGDIFSRTAKRVVSLMAGLF